MDKDSNYSNIFIIFDIGKTVIKNYIPEMKNHNDSNTYMYNYQTPKSIFTIISL